MLILEIFMQKVWPIYVIYLAIVSYLVASHQHYFFFFKWTLIFIHFKMFLSYQLLKIITQHNDQDCSYISRTPLRFQLATHTCTARLKVFIARSFAALWNCYIFRAQLMLSDSSSFATAFGLLSCTGFLLTS